MRHQVTWSDIFTGTRENCAKCPVARSLGRSVSSKWNVCIYAGMSYRSYKAHISQDMSYNSTILDLPEAVNKFIFNFDRGKIDGPISFDLELPNNILGS